MDEEFKHVLSTSRLIAEDYPDVVFIGGIAVYMHAVNNRSKMLEAEGSHDSDFMASLGDLGIMRDVYVVKPNTRLAKHELFRDGVSFDVYVHHHNKLVVPYDEVFVESVKHGNLRVACLEHLLILKIEAEIDRRGTPKGEKDRRDILRIADATETMHVGILRPYLRPKHLSSLRLIESSRTFDDVKDGNAHEAKKLREMFSSFVEKISEV